MFEQLELEAALYSSAPEADEETDRIAEMSKTRYKPQWETEARNGNLKEGPR